MSRTNCFLPRSGFCLNFRVRIVNSLMATDTEHAAEDGGDRHLNLSIAAA